MPTIKQIKLSSANVFKKLSDIQHGTLLQIATSMSTVETCLRAKSKFDDKNASGVVILEGENAGRFLKNDDIKDFPVIDLTNLAELAINVLSPQFGMNDQSVAGCVYIATNCDGGTFQTMAVGWDLKMDFVIGHVWLDGPSKGLIEQVTEKMYLGTAIVNYIN